MLGNFFINKCFQSEVITDPWSHTVTENHIDQVEFDSLKQQCKKLLDIKMEDMPTYKDQTEQDAQQNTTSQHTGIRLEHVLN